MGIFVKKGTRIVVKAFTGRGRKALMLNKVDEEALRSKFKLVVPRDVPKKHRAYLRTVSAYVPHDDGLVKEHHILGFKRMSLESRHAFYMGVKKSFFDNGCTVDDFGVEFVDE